MEDSGDLPIDDPLSLLLDSYAVAAGDIEGRIMAQVSQEEDRDSLRADVAALRADVSALRAELAEIKRILLARNNNDAVTARLRTPPTDDTRGDRLLPYAPREVVPILLG